MTMANGPSPDPLTPSSALHTDLYQISMCYAYWRAGKHDETAVFDLFFRKNPFGGEYTLFAGLTECLNFIEGFHFTPADLTYLRTVLPPATEDEFFAYLAQISCRDVTVWTMQEGCVVLPHTPLLTLRGPLATVQLLETALLNLVNYASLVCTNAARFRQAAGSDVQLFEFGLRRAQGPNGGLTASKYCYVGGFDATSNVLAGRVFDIPVCGTHAHAFVNSFTSLSELRHRSLQYADGSAVCEDFVALCLLQRSRVLQCIPYSIAEKEVSDGELAAFISFARAFPSRFLALIDTYDILKSGVVNFAACALALHQLGYRARGVRLDSGDLAYLSKQVRHVFKTLSQHFAIDYFADFTIVASNDINEETLVSLREQGHCITAYGVGTHLVTCQRQPALGCVYKLVSIQNEPRIKLSQDVSKITMPGHKVVYRLFGKDGMLINDLMMLAEETPPEPGKTVLCRHPFSEQRRAYVTPASVKCLHHMAWNGERVDGTDTLVQLRGRVDSSLASLREDHKRSLNPTPCKVSVSEKLYDFFHSYWMANAPIGVLD